MSLDLNSLLRDWPHEPGAIKVRKIIGLDGREKLQLRIDLGRHRGTVTKKVNSDQ